MNDATNPRLESPSLSRRDFLLGTSAALALASVGSAAEIPATSVPRFPIVGFTKPFQHLAPAQLADFVSSLGWDGIECPVRSKGQVEPEAVEQGLPVVKEALQKNGLSIEQVATDILSLDQPHAEKTLRTCSRLGLKRLRLGFFRYRESTSPWEQLNELRPRLKDLAAACTDLGLWAGIQNHSGKDWVGAPVWDVVGLLQEINSPSLGLTFDIGHATLEGGLSWPLHARIAAPFQRSLIVKDFRWEKGDQGWHEHWCPLGEGMVQRSFFETLKKSSFAGPVIQHHEYELPEGPALHAALKRDQETLRTWLS